MRLERALVEISEGYLQGDEAQDPHPLIERAIARIGTLCAVDRCYVFLFDWPAKLMRNTEEWCASGIVPQIEQLQAVPLASGPNWTATLARGQTIQIEQVAALPEDWAVERDFLAAQDIQSVLAVPLRFADRTLGFIGFDAVRAPHRWLPDERHLLALLGNLTAGCLARYRHVQALKASEDRFRRVVDNLADVVYVADMHSFELLFLNETARRLSGAREGQICWQAIQVGQTGPCPFCTNDQLVDANGRPTAGVVWEFRNTREQRWYECRDQAIVWPDGRLVRLEIATNIDDRKRAEALQRFGAYQAGLAEMATSVLHNVGNAITKVIHDTELVYRATEDLARIAALLGTAADLDAHDPDPDEGRLTTILAVQQAAVAALEELQREVLAPRTVSIRDNVAHIAEIVRLQQAVASPRCEHQRLSLRQTVAHALDLLDGRRQMARFGLFIATEIGPDADEIELPFNQCLQALINTIKNAIEAIIARPPPAPPGHLTIRTEALPNDRLRLTIQDNGIGLTPEERTAAFRFGYTTKPEGSGFGLHVTATFIREQGGEIRLESPGRGLGATMIWELPRHRSSGSLIG